MAPGQAGTMEAICLLQVTKKEKAFVLFFRDINFPVKIYKSLFKHLRDNGRVNRPLPVAHCLLLMVHSLHRGSPAENQRKQEQYDENEEQDFGNGGGTRSNTTESEDRRDNGHDQEYNCPT